MNVPWVIINADDVGLSAEVDEGVLEVVRAGRVTSVSIFVNPPFRPPIGALKDTPVSIGLHLNLAIGLPLSPSGLSALRAQDGRFRPRWFQDDGEFDGDEIRDELMRQLEAFQVLTGTMPTHLDTHKHVHARNRHILAMLAGIAKALGVPLRAPDEVVRETLRSWGVRVTDHFVGGVEPSPYWTEERLATVLGDLPLGVTEMMCHPGRIMPEMEGLRYTRQRDVERQTLLSPRTARVLGNLSLATFVAAPLGGEGHGM